MCRKDHWRSGFWNFVQLLHKYGAFGLQGFDDVAIVDDLMAHVDRGAEALERQLDNLYGAVHAGAEATRCGQENGKWRALVLHA
jgi:hypothetical protein